MGQTEVTKTIVGKAVVMPNGTKATEWEKDFVKIIARISSNLPKKYLLHNFKNV